MEKVNIEIKRKSLRYPILVGSNIIKDLNTYIDLSKYSSIFIISDSNVGPLYVVNLKKVILKKNKKINYYEFRAGEKSKTWKTVVNIIRNMIEVRFDRKGLVINIGGGVVTDMGGFIASIYQRGVDFLNISTTILGMVDASLGGKFGIDFDNLKNYIGIFNHPKLVMIDVDMLKTLPDRDFISGFAEIIKHGIIYNKDYFNFVISKDPKKFSSNELVKIIDKSCKIKANIIEKDEKEEGLRKILNFGHTVGHALESLTLEKGKPLLHGEAVSLGICAETKISSLLGYITNKDFRMVELSLRNAGLPIHIKGLDYEEIKKKMLKDKKNVNNKIKWVLIKNIGEAIYDVEVEQDIVFDALNYILN